MTSKKSKPRTEITPQAAGDILGLTPGWLAALRSKRQGPPAHKSGRKVYYVKEEVEAYKTANTKTVSGESVLLVSIKTMALGRHTDGSAFLTINGVEHPVDASTGAVIIAQKS